MANEVKSRINPTSGVPEHRHGLRSWHWAWSTHEGRDSASDPDHKGIFVADPRTAEEIKAKRGYTSTNAAIKGTSRGPRTPALSPAAEMEALDAELAALNAEIYGSQDRLPDIDETVNEAGEIVKA